jgi:hypothetical protein
MIIKIQFYILENTYLKTDLPSRMPRKQFDLLKPTNIMFL